MKKAVRWREERRNEKRKEETRKEGNVREETRWEKLEKKGCD